ncbi:MAG: pitrilysin family protein [Armatimonadetes bacterium]|nr:pitrilysin family protein [Armatimonadota bacterium]
MVKKEILPNGLRILSESVPHVQSISIGVWISSGGRDEDDLNRGVSHFIEHMLFKGTERRTARQIADEFDSIGGQLNAFTEKEYTCYFAKVLSEHLPVALDVLSDMLLNSKLDPQEIVLEKNVVLEEIKRHEDTPEDLVHDMLVETVWSGHPLGKSIIGTQESVGSLTRADLVEFMRTSYAPDSIVIAAAGDLVHEEFVDRISGLFSGLEGDKIPTAHEAPAFSTESLLTDKLTEQVHFCVGAPGFSQLDPERYSMALIDTTLGGGMSSRLFQEIRENRGLVYAIGSYAAAYREGGFFTVYGGTSVENVEEVVELVRAEFANVRDSNITDEELNRAKNQIKGGLVLSQESMSNRMMRMAKSELYFGRTIPLEELLGSIWKVTHDDIAHVAERIFTDSPFPVVAIGPFNSRKA